MAQARVRLSELEAFVLGLIWQFGPVSPYDVRRHMQQSPSTQWSASAGAIYPLVRKLERNRLINGNAEKDDSRKRHTYQITAGGRSALQAWLGPPLTPEAVTVTYDPLRTRIRFLEVLPPAKRREWIEAAAAGLDTVESKVRDWQKLYAAEGEFVNILTRNAELELKTRRKWIAEIAEYLKREQGK